MVETKVPLVAGLKGLCLTCNHALDCSLRKNSGSVIIHCEEFDNYVAPRVNNPASADPFTGTLLSVRVPVNEEAGKYFGLCINCDNRTACKNSQCEGGVWHCEEYC